jgi:hypothetical protein
MSVDLAPADLVRLQCGESIPDDGDDSDTLFTDGQIQTFLDQCNQMINAATAMAWRAKAAIFATQVDVVEGNSQRKMSQAYQQAKSQATFWASQPENNSLIGKSRQIINRRSMPW